MGRNHRSALRAVIALLLVSLTIPLEVLQPDSVAVTAGANRSTGSSSPTAPSSPGVYRAASSATSTPINSITVSKPTGTTTNDVLVASVTVRGTPTITAPSGWTLIRSDANGSTLTQSLYRKVAGGSEPSSYAWTFSQPVTSTVAGIAAYSGVDTTTPVDVSGGQTNASSTSVTAPSITTTVANTMLVGVFGTAKDVTFTAASGMTERIDVNADGTNVIGGEVAEETKATAGATGTRVATASAAAANVGQLVALKPSGTITFRSAASAESVPALSLTINSPSGVQADDVLVAGINIRGSDTISAPAGWIQVRTDVNGSTLRQSIFVRTAVSGEPSSHTFTFSSAVSASTGGIIAFDDLDPVNPVDVSGGQANASSTSVVAPSITSTVAEGTLVGFFATSDDYTFTPPSGMTERYDVLVDANSDAASSAADVSSVSAGATGAKTATASGSAANIGALVLLRPATATANLGVQNQHTFESWDLGGGDTLSVNAATRNAVISHPIVSLPIRGSSISINATYNAKDPADVGMGPGWRLDVFRRLRLNGDNTVTFTDGSGARHTFTNPSTVGSITTYTRPATIYGDLVKDTTPNPDRFTLTYRDKSKDKFEISGGAALLVREEDRFGNGVDLAYSGGTTNVATITDTAPNPDRVIDFTWDTAPTPDHLTTITDWAYISSGVVQMSNSGSRRATSFAYDGSGYLTSWTDPLYSSGSCGGPASHKTCLAYTSGLVTSIAKTQTYTTESGGTLGTSTRTVTTEIAYSGSDVSTVTDAEEQAQGTPERTTFTIESSTKIRVDRPTTTTSYGTVAAGDQYGRIQSVWRKLDGTTTLETRTTWDSTYPTEPATVTANYGALLSTPARTTTYTYQASSMGLVSKIAEPFTATDDRWTEYSYNTNNDVVLETVSFEGSATDKTVTKSCYTTQSNSCSDASPGLMLVRRIERWVSGGASDEDTNVVTDYAYDAYGRLTSTARANRDGAGTLLDSRIDASTYDDKGNQTSDIANYADGVVTLGSGDSDPAPAVARTDLTTVYTYDTAGNGVSTADPRRALGASATTYVADAFGRSVPDAWGTADTGGTYSGTNSDFDVASGIGTIAVNAGTAREADLTSVSVRDAEFLVKLKVDRAAVGGDLYAGLNLRRQDSSNYYQARLTYSPTGVLKVSGRKTAAGTDTTLGSEYTSLATSTSDWFWFRGQISGTTSVNLKLKVWKEGTTEPGSWNVDATDASPPAALQGTGHLGARFSSSGAYSGATPITNSWDSLSYTSIGGGGGTLTADDYVSRSTFDPLGQLISTSTPTTPGVGGAAETATTTYDELGAVRSSTDIADLVTATLSDRAGRPLTTYEDSAPAGSAYITAQMTYDADGKVLTAMDRRQAAAAPGYALGWTAHAYDGLGRQTSVTEAESSSPDVSSETRTTYDGLHRLVATEVGYGSTSSQLTSLTLDLGGRATATDDGFTCTTSTYDYRDLVLTTADALDTSTCASNIGSRTVTNTYDGMGRLIQAEVTAGPDNGDRPSIATYDAVGNALTAGKRLGGATTTTTFTRTKLDQVVTEARPDGSTAKSTYDPVGNLTDACTWASGATVGNCLAVGTAGWTNPPTNSSTTRWDARNGRIGLTDSESNETVVYDPASGYSITALYAPTNAEQTKEHQSLYQYDGRKRLTSVTLQLCTVSAGHNCSATTPTGSVSYEYDDSDNRKRVTENNGSTSSDYRYCHDARNQLTGRGSTTACDTSSVETFSYDDAGNRIQAVEAGTTRNFAYSAEGLLCDVETAAAASCTGGNVTSDDAGRVSDINPWHFVYDAKARLVSACKDPDCVGSGFDRVDFEYDGEGHRTKITETPSSGAPVVWTFRYHDEMIVAEYKDGVLVRELATNGNGTVIRFRIPAGQAEAGSYLVTWNGHGDAMAIHKIGTSGSLTLANSYTYGTWGRPTTATHNSIPDLGFRFLYVGSAQVQWDAAFGLDLIYMRARHYSPSLGRFLQPDPSRIERGAFTYVNSNPVSGVDPTGAATMFFSFASARARSYTSTPDCTSDWCTGYVTDHGEPNQLVVQTRVEAGPWPRAAYRSGFLLSNRVQYRGPTGTRTITLKVTANIAWSEYHFLYAGTTSNEVLYSIGLYKHTSGYRPVMAGVLDPYGQCWLGVGGLAGCSDFADSYTKAFTFTGRVSLSRYAYYSMELRIWTRAWAFSAISRTRASAVDLRRASVTY